MRHAPEVSVAAAIRAAPDGNALSTDRSSDADIKTE
jgi:hypothetical protein